MKSLIVNALAFGICFVPVSQRVSQPEKSQQTAKRNQGKQPPESEAINSIDASISKIQQRQAETLQAIENQNKEDLATQRELVKYTKWLVYVGVLQGFVFFLTLLAIHREASIANDIAVAARNNAQAAKASADAIIVENRPWLLMSEIMVPYLVPAVEATPGAERFSYCITMTKNYGKTPARVTTLWGRLEIGESPTTPPKDLVVEIGRTAPIPQTYVFPPGETKAAEAMLSSGFISPEARDNVLTNKTKFLWLLGFVKYRDTFEREPSIEYESRFCYLYETRLNSPAPFWTPAGPPEYNRAT